MELQTYTHITIETILNAHVNVMSVYHKFTFKFCLEKTVSS